MDLQKLDIKVKGFIRTILQILNRKKPEDFNCPIIHRKSIAEAIFKDMIKTKIFYHKFKKPPNLAILVTHNFKKRSLFELNLDFLGIKDYVILNDPDITEWNHIYKHKWILEYLKSHKFKEEIILYCDADDCILIEDPQKIIEIFLDYDCDLLFMSTNWDFGYPTKDSRIWATIHNGTNKRHLNAGVYIGKKAFLINFLEDLLNIIEAIQLKKHPIWKSISDYYNKKFKYSYSTKSTPPNLKIQDQNIIRYMHPKYPQIKIDISNKLAYRNGMNLLTKLKYVINKIIYAL